MALSTTNLFSLLTALAVLAPTALAHGHVKEWTIDGVAKAGFNPSYAAQYGATAERPTDNSDQGFADWTSTIVACGGMSTGSGLLTWDAKAGSTISTTWNTWPESHQGSITDWAAACPASGCDGVEAASLGWFKIHEENWNGASWPTVDLIKKNNLKHTFKIPTTLPDGDYLIRHELLAMHTVGAPQVYPVCAQFAITGGSGSLPSETVKFPAAYNINPDFKTFDIYSNKNDAFVPPGPTFGGSSDPVPAPAPAPAEPTAPASSAAAPASPSASAPASPSSEVEVPAPAEPTTIVPTPTVVAPAPEGPSSSAVVAPEPSQTVPEEEEEEPVTSEPATPEPTTPEQPEETESEYPAEPTATVVQPAPSDVVPTPSQAPVTPPVTGGGDNLQKSNGSIGGAAPGVYQSGEKYKTGSNTFNFLADALYRSCDEQRNNCYDFANSQYGQTSSIQAQCETQSSSCKSSISWSKRDNVVARWAKRGASVY